MTPSTSTPQAPYLTRGSQVHLCSLHSTHPLSRGWSFLSSHNQGQDMGVAALPPGLERGGTSPRAQGPLGASPRSADCRLPAAQPEPERQLSWACGRPGPALPALPPRSPASQPRSAEREEVAHRLQVGAAGPGATQLSRPREKGGPGRAGPGAEHSWTGHLTPAWLSRRSTGRTPRGTGQGAAWSRVCTWRL